MDIEPDENAGEEPDCLECSQAGLPGGCEDCGRIGPPQPDKFVFAPDPWAEAPF